MTRHDMGVLTVGLAKVVIFALLESMVVSGWW